MSCFVENDRGTGRFWSSNRGGGMGSDGIVVKGAKERRSLGRRV